MRNITLRIIRTVLFLLLFMAIGGNFKWIQGWIFCIFLTIQMVVIMLYLQRKNPELLEERTSSFSKENQKTWDKIFLAIYMLCMLIWIIIMPLDSQRLHFTPEFPIYINVIGFISILISSVLISLTMAQNSFASHTVRIQKERGQHVISNGVYSIVRHPMYLGSAFWNIGTPLLLSSYLGLAFGIIIIFLFVIRIIGEEKMLTEELDGYLEYKEKTRYRLIPFIW